MLPPMCVCKYEITKHIHCTISPSNADGPFCGIWTSEKCHASLVERQLLGTITGTIK
jgi:hypothetical protein